MVTVELLRQIAFSLLEVTEDPHFEKTAFKVKKKIFATYDEKTRQTVVKLSLVDQNVFSSINMEGIFPVSNKWGKQGWTCVQMDQVEEEVFKDLLLTAYREVAPKKLADQVNHKD